MQGTREEQHIPSQIVGSEHLKVFAHPGYRLEPLVTGLDFPTAITFSRDKIWVTEAGFPETPPRVKEIDTNGNVTTILSPADLAEGQFLPPLTDITFRRIGYGLRIVRRGSMGGSSEQFQSFVRTIRWGPLPP